MNSADLARKVNLPVPTIHRLVTGKSTRPYRSSLEPIAEFFSINVDQLLGEQPLSDKQTSNNNNTTKYIPIIKWQDIENQTPKKDIHEKVIVGTNQISNKSFCVTMPDSSMEPLFPENSQLIFDESITPKDRCYVLVKLNNCDKIVFRQLLIDSDTKYIKSLNPDLNKFPMRIIDDNDTIIAVLAESRLVYNI